MGQGRSPAKPLRARAKQLIVRRRFDDAVELLTEGLKQFPRCYKMYRLRALAQACRREYALTRSDAETLIALMPNAPEGYYLKGFSLYHEGAYLEAGEAFGAGMEHTPLDRVMKQAFWDAVTLASQTRSNATAPL